MCSSDCVFLCLIVFFVHAGRRASYCSNLGRVRILSNPNPSGLADSREQRVYLGSTESHPLACGRGAFGIARAENQFSCLDFAIVTAQVNRYFQLFFDAKFAGKMGSEPMFNATGMGTVFCLTDSGGEGENCVGVSGVGVSEYRSAGVNR